ncbi:MAG: hypothetical protein K6F51_15060 [Acetatifactor sp.]|nr:hypothetical protein [Acetatifactor sp.]
MKSSRGEAGRRKMNVKSLSLAYFSISRYNKPSCLPGGASRSGNPCGTEIPAERKSLRSESGMALVAPRRNGRRKG